DAGAGAGAPAAHRPPGARLRRRRPLYPDARRRGVPCRVRRGVRMTRYRRLTPRPASAPAGAPALSRDAAPTFRWAELLEQAVREPGTIARCYSAFWSYSLGNQLAALSQCQGRG